MRHVLATVAGTVWDVPGAAYHVMKIATFPACSVPPPPAPDGVLIPINPPPAPPASDALRVGHATATRYAGDWTKEGCFARQTSGRHPWSRRSMPVSRQARRSRTLAEEGNACRATSATSAGPRSTASRRRTSSSTDPTSTRFATSIDWTRTSVTCHASAR